MGADVGAKLDNIKNLVEIKIQNDSNDTATTVNAINVLAGKLDGIVVTISKESITNLVNGIKAVLEGGKIKVKAPTASTKPKVGSGIGAAVGNAVAKGMSGMFGMIIKIGNAIVDLLKPTSLGMTIGIALMVPIMALIGMLWLMGGDITSFIEPITQMIGMMLEIGTKLIGIVLRIVEVLEPPLLMIVDAIGQLLNMLVPPLLDICMLIGDLAVRLLDALMPLLEVVADLIVKLVEALVPPVTAILEYIVNVICTYLPIITEIFNVASEFIVKLYESVMPVILEIVDFIGELLQACIPVITAVLEGVMEILDALMPLVEVILEVVTDLVTNLIVPLVTTILEALMPVILTIFDVIKTILDALMPVINFVLTVFSGLFTVVGGIIKAVLWPIKKVMDIIQGIIDFFVNALNDAPFIGGFLDDKENEQSKAVEEQNEAAQATAANPQAPAPSAEEQKVHYANTVVGFNNVEGAVDDSITANRENALILLGGEAAIKNSVDTNNKVGLLSANASIASAKIVQGFEAEFTEFTKHCFDYQDNIQKALAVLIRLTKANMFGVNVKASAKNAVNSVREGVGKFVDSINPFSKKEPSGEMTPTDADDSGKALLEQEINSSNAILNAYKEGNEYGKEMKTTLEKIFDLMDNWKFERKENYDIG